MQSLWLKSGLAGIACFVCYFLAILIPWPESQLGFVFAVAAFATLLGMIIVQLAVGAGIRETTGGLDEASATALRRGLRLIDLGLDVAWDFLMGTAMICWGVAMRRRGARSDPGGACPWPSWATR